MKPHRGLPGSRAVVGGLLVAVGAIGTWVAATGSSSGPDETFVVADGLIAPGQRIEADHVRSIQLDLPDEVRAAVFTDAEAVIGSVALGPIEAGELVQAGSLSTGSVEPSAELSFSVETDWAVAGTLRVGDRIDVYATDDRASATSTELVLHEVVIRSISSPGGDGLGSDRSQTITVGVADPAAVESAVTATRTATVTVVRVTDLAEGEP